MLKSTSHMSKKGNIIFFILLYFFPQRVFAYFSCIFILVCPVNLDINSKISAKNDKPYPKKKKCYISLWIYGVTTLSSWILIIEIVHVRTDKPYLKKRKYDIFSFILFLSTMSVCLLLVHFHPCLPGQLRY